MKKVLLVGHDGEVRLPYENSKAWAAFARVLKENDWEIVSDYSDDVDAIIANSHKHNFMSNDQFEKIDHAKRVLILWEPYVVETERYQPEILRQYAHIYAPSRMWADRVDGIAFNWPQDAINNDKPMSADWENRSEKVVVIQGNKFSARKGKLYSLRRRVLSQLDPQRLDLYGTNWNSGTKFDWWHWSRSLINSKLLDISLRSAFGIGRKYSNYQGAVDDKQETLESYQICLVIENSADFVSEKLFDSVRAGCLTIYVGPTLEYFGLKSDSAIIANNSKRSVLNAVERVFEMSSYDRMQLAKLQRENVRILSSDWENEFVLSSLAEKIVQKLA